MRKPSQRSIQRLATCAALAIFIAPLALSGARPAYQPPQIQIDASRIKVNSRPAIPFRAFDIVDPQTGRPVAAEASIRLRDGRTVKAGVYYAQINKMERAANALGYSLRTTGTVDLVQVTTDKSKLQSQAQLIVGGHRRPDSGTPAPTIADTIGQRIRQQAGSADRQRSIGQILADPALRNRLNQSGPSWTGQWNFDLGDPATFDVNGGVKLTVAGTANGAAVSGEAKLAAALLNNRKELLRLTGAASAPGAGTMNIQFAVFFLGASIYNYNQNLPAPMEKQDSVSKSFDFPYTYRFTLLDVPMSVTVGIRGTVGAKYLFQAQPFTAFGVIDPSADIKGYVEVGPDVESIKLQVGSDLTVLNDKMRLIGIVELKTNGANPPTFEKWGSAYNDLHALDGDLYVKGCVNVGLGDWCAKYTFFKWQGVQTSGYLFMSGPLAGLAP